MRVTSLKIALAVSLIFNLSVLGAAGYFHYAKNGSWVSPFGVKMQTGRFLFEELGLRPEQTIRMRADTMAFRTEIDRKRGEIAARRNHLFSLMRVDNPDLNAINVSSAEISRMQGEVEVLVTAHILELKASLEKDQQRKFLDLIESTMSRGKAECASMPSH